MDDMRHEVEDLICSARRAAWTILCEPGDAQQKLCRFKPLFEDVKEPNTERLAAILATYLTTVFSGQIGRCEEQDRKKGEHPLHSGLKRLFDQPFACPFEHAATKLALGELEMIEDISRESWRVRSLEVFTPMPGFKALLEDLQRKSLGQRTAALSSIRFAACMTSSTLVPAIVEACSSRLLDDKETEQNWRLALDILARINRRSAAARPAVKKRKQRGIHQSSQVVIDDLLNFHWRHVAYEQGDILPIREMASA